ncbi:MAG: hypothetical protein ABSE08_07460 [Syntrophobacteraceae bacterium]|jgi:hypothetical protein
MKDKIPILHIWADPADAERLINELAKSGVNFEAKLVRTQAEYVSALVKAKYGLIIADERAETAGSGSDELSLYQIAEQISPGTTFVLLGDRPDTAAEAAVEATNFSTMSRNDLYQLKNIINRVLNDLD